MYKIYIQKSSKNTEFLYKVFVFSGKELVWLNAFYSEDVFNLISESKVTQVFGNKHFKARTSAGVEVFAEGKHVSCGDGVVLQLKSVAVADLESKAMKATTNVAIPFGPVILHPFRKDITLSKRTNESNSEKAYYLLNALQAQQYNFGITLRKQALNYKVQEIQRMLAVAEKLYENKSYNSVSLKILNDVFFFLSKGAEVLSNDFECGELLSNWYYDATNIPIELKELEGSLDVLDSCWDSFCACIYSLGENGYIELQETKACIAVDINAGSIKNPLEANTLALKKLPQILAFGKFGGKCVIDLVGLDRKLKYDIITKKIKQEFDRLNVSAQVFGVTPMGMLEIIMPRRGLPLWWINKKF